MADSYTDFVLENVVRLRLVNATGSDVAAVQRQLGPLRTETQGDADLVIRFMDKLPGQDSMRILGNWEAGYSDEAFWILRGVHGFPIALQVPFDQVGEPCELLCRHSIPALPLLGSIINLFALQKGLLPLHASAFVYGGDSVLVTGWTKGGKTEALLGFAEQGASYLGDEWIYIDPVRETMRGIPQPIHLWDWHLDSGRNLSCLTKSQRFKLATLRNVQRALQPFAGWQSPTAKLAQRMFEFISVRRHVRLSPLRLFGDRVQRSAPCPDKVFFMASHATAEIEVCEMAIERIISRMAFSLEEEFKALTACYRQYRFAFPNRANPLIEQLPSLLRRRLAEALLDKEGFAVWHPYPVSPRELFRAMSPFVHRATAELPSRVANSSQGSTNPPAVKAAT